jgi:energy-coupling factor transporter ATP-binding protein EcfA2
MSVAEFSSPTELAAALRSRLPQGGSICIAVDGVDGSGKTRLASSLASMLNAKHVELDKYLLSGQCLYADALQYHHLASTLSEAMQLGLTLIVEGLCVLKVLKRLSIRQDLLVYVKRMGPADSWTDGSYCGERGSPAEFSKDVHRMFAPIDLDGSSKSVDDDISLLLEVAFYHFDFEPLREADVVFLSRSEMEPQAEITA